MNSLINNLLFNHTYLRELTADTTIDPEIPFSPKDLSDWYSFLDTSSTKTMVDSWVRPLLSLLELDIQPLGSDDEHTFELTTDYDRDTVVGICYVAPPGADLDTTIKGLFWMAQAVLSARRHEPTLRWVILTNGDLWRLLDAQALRRYEAFVQIDVGQLALGADDPSALRVFFRCFYRKAFEQDGDGKTGIEKLLEFSDHATEKAEKHLKERVSGTDGIMAQLCLGLVRSTGKSKFIEEERDAIYRDATTLLYRMLFLLYAESRALLPIDNPGYAEVSMANLVEMAREGQQRGLDRLQATDFWERLKRLSNAIYESDPELGIPAYNGGLFDDDDHPYLRDGFIANQHLYRAIFDLAFLPNSNDHQEIDYRDLSVRHLGSLYEGMIEYKLFIAEEPMLARRDKKGNIHFLIQNDPGGLRRNDQEIKDGEVYFAQSSGERRATGTYYTPEYIVDYIVRNTVVKSLEERRAPLEEKLKTLLDEILVADPDDRPSLQRTVDEELLKFVEEQVLTFTVCDPAMGSGHFLVNAAHNIADYIVETLYLTTWENQYTDIDPLNWRRCAAERCLYGVDISDMAVELAKLSLWLATMAQGNPLSFLKHHLRQGNSLVGARLEDLAALQGESKLSPPSRKEKKLLDSGQLTMLDSPAFSQHLKSAKLLLAKITTRVVETIADVKAQEADYELAQVELALYRVFADIVVGKHFGLEIEETELHQLAYYVLEQGVDPPGEYKKLLLEAKKISEDRHFFHWDLEFFVNLHNRHSNLNNPLAQFDVVCGNPPWVSLRGKHASLEFDEYESRYYDIKYPENTYMPNLYEYFVAKALCLFKENGWHSFVVPDRLGFNSSLEYLRDRMLNSYSLHSLYYKMPFPDVIADTLIYIVENRTTLPTSSISVTDHGNDIVFVSRSFYNQVGDKNFLFFKDQRVLRTIEAIDSAPVVKLCELTSTTSGFGGKSQLITNHRISPKQKEVLKGKDIGFYVLNNKHYFEFVDQNLTGRTRDERKLGYSPKVLLRKTGEVLFAAYDEVGIYPEQSVYFLYDYNPEYSPLYFLVIINSNIFRYYYKHILVTNRDSTPQLKKIHLDRFPILSIKPTTDFVSRSALLDKAKESYKTYITNGDEFPILKLCENYLNHQPEQSYAVHDILVFLAKEMVDVSMQLQTEIQSFLSSLKSQIGVDFDELTGKTTLQNFLGDYQKSQPHLEINKLIFILIKNKRKLEVDPNEHGFQHELEKRYQASLDVLLPIKRRLAMTNRLIDEIVYRLYGLTEEEISIVEGKA